ncbi:MAG: SDR family oxidoreductase [Actinobacteria bacterium]|nr:SDR family oxidoreductase [Actinomycetota bacterium]
MIDLGLRDKGCFVTGAAGGIGREIAVQLAQAGARVAVVDLDQGACEGVVSAMEDPARHLAIGADLRDLAGHDALLGRARDAFGRLDVLVCAAAVLRRRATIDDITEDDWDAQLDTNLKAVFFLNRAAAKIFREAGRGGRIVNFSSQGWWSGGFGGSVVYSASKGGIVSMTRGLARSLAPHGITVNHVAPGAADTAMMRSGMTDADLEKFVEMIPMGRMAQPGEVASTVVFLASDLAGYVTGATMNVSGGQLMY